VNKLSRSFADFITNQMSASSGLLTNVRSLMTTHVQTCGEEDSLARAAQLMWEADCGSVPVLEIPKSSAHHRPRRLHGQLHAGQAARRNARG